MKNKFFAVIAALAFGLPAVHSETDYKALPIIRDIRLGVDNKNQIETLRVRQDATIGDDLTVTDDLTVGGDLALSGAQSTAGNYATTDGFFVGAIQTVTSPTNGQEITVSQQYVEVVNTAAGVTCTLAAATADMPTFVFITHTSSNSITFADGGNLALGAARTLGSNDVLGLILLRTGSFREFSLGNN